MAAYGRIAFGIGPFGAYAPTGTGVTQATPLTGLGGAKFGTTGGLGKALPEHILTISALREVLYTGARADAVSTGHLRALLYTGSFGAVYGSPAAALPGLRAKTWLATAAVAAPTPGYADIGGFIMGGKYGSLDLAGLLLPRHISDITALLQGVPPADVLAALVPIPGADLPAATLAIASVNLRAYGGGHYPEDVLASLSAVLPVNLLGLIRGGFTAVADLGAELTQTGEYSHLPGYLKVLQRAAADLAGSVTSRRPVDLAARLVGWCVSDLSASLVTQRERGIRAIVTGFARGVTRDLGAFLRKTAAGMADLPVESFRAKIGAHTSDKLPNIDKVPRVFFQNVYALGTKGGLHILTLEPIYGIFPDLHAAIYAQDFFRAHIRGFIRVATAGTSSLATQVAVVSPFVSVNRLLISLHPLLNLPANLVRWGGFLPMRGSVRVWHRSSTSQAADAGFVSTASSFRFYLGTTAGLFLPPQVPSRVRLETFVNTHLRPDLHAVVSGFHVVDFGASIENYPFLSLPASIGMLDISHIAHISAWAAPTHPADISASVTPGGFFTAFPAAVSATGLVRDMPGYIMAYVLPTARTTIAVSTAPFTNLGAVINYGSLVTCAPSSMVVSLSAYVRVFAAVRDLSAGAVSLGAELNALRGVAGLPATVTGLRRTRISILAVEFLAKTRDSARLGGIVTPVGRTFADMAATVAGLSHEADMPATLNIVRLVPAAVDFTQYEVLVNMDAPDEEKRVYVSFRSQVNSYVFDQLTSMVYATDRGTWVLDLRTLEAEDSFYDLAATNGTYALSSVSEYFSVDEAIRAALVILCEHRQVQLAASVVASGGVAGLRASLGITALDHFADVAAKAVPVYNLPDILASVNTGSASSSLRPLSASVTPARTAPVSLGGEIAGFISGDMAAEITVA